MKGFTLLLLCHLIACFAQPQLSAEGSFNFSGIGAFVELDTQAISCSRDTQKLFTIKFDVYLETNTSVLFSGVSGIFATNQSAVDYEPLALLVYAQRPYFILTVMRLSDFRVPFHLHHAFGIFDRPWREWHRVEVIFSKWATSQIEVTFKVDTKSNRGNFPDGNILWPDWSIMKSTSAHDALEKNRYHVNEAFLGLPPIGTVARSAVNSLQRYLVAMEPTRPSFQQDFAYEFTPFQGSIKSVLIASECACGMRNFFGPKIIQIGPGVELGKACDVKAFPLLWDNIVKGICASKNANVPCGCAGLHPTCYCPSKNLCRYLKIRETDSTRVALLKKPSIDSRLGIETRLEAQRGLLSENPATFNQLDSCFANIFTCNKPINYQFWVFIDQLGVMKGSTTIVKHASSLNSPFFMEVSFKGLPRKGENSQSIMAISAEVRASPHFIWRITGCSTGIRVNPGQWHQLRVYWNKKALKLFIDGNLCDMTGAIISLINATDEQRFNSRRTPLLFLGEHQVEDFVFNDDRLLPSFFHSDLLTTVEGSWPESTISTRSNDFYASIILDGSRPLSGVRIPGLEASLLRVHDKLMVQSERYCHAFLLPANCNATCGVELERQSSVIKAFSKNAPLPASVCESDNREVTQPALAPRSLIRLFNRGRNDLLQRQLIHVEYFPKLDCKFSNSRSGQSSTTLDNLGACEPNAALSEIKFQLSDAFPQSSINDTLMVSRTRALLTAQATNEESLCLRDLRLCRYGVTLSFWMLPLPATESDKKWSILRWLGASGSSLSVQLERRNNAYSLETALRSLQGVSGSEAIFQLWKAKTQVETENGFWTLVTISWSQIAGLSVKINGTLVGSVRHYAEETSTLEFPTTKGLCFGHDGRQDSEDGLIIDDLQFIPAELNHLAFVGQNIDVSLSNQGLRECEPTTCMEDSSCYPIKHDIAMLGDFCQCDHPWRICRELPGSLIIPREKPASTTTALPTIATSPTTTTTESPPLQTTTPSVETELIGVPDIDFISSEEENRTGNFSRSLENHTRVLLRSGSGTEGLSCDPRCENGGICVFNEGAFQCDCSATSFWGKTCTREHVGWLSLEGGVFGIKPHRKVFATRGDVWSEARQRFIFRTPILEDLLVESLRRRSRRSFEEEQMALLTIKNQFFTCGFIQIDSDLYLITEGDFLTRTRLIPCLQNVRIRLDDGAPHVVEMEHKATFVRLKVDGETFYPKKLLPSSCDKWLFFSLAPHMNNRTYQEHVLPQPAGLNSQLGEAFLGAWPNGEGEFKGAIGGWMIDGEEMISPTTDEPLDDTTNTVYHRDKRFLLSEGDFYWLRLNSLTPVTVLSDTVTQATSPKSTVRSWILIIGCSCLVIPTFLFICWLCLHFCGRRRTKGKVGWGGKYSPFHPATTKPTSDPIFPDEPLKLPATRIDSLSIKNSKYIPPLADRLNANRISPSANVENLWTSRVLTLQTFNMNPDSTELKPSMEGSLDRFIPVDETDDIEEILVTENGECVITLAANDGVSIKQWSTFDGRCHRELLSRSSNSTKSVRRGVVTLHESGALLFVDKANNAQLYSLRGDQSPVSVRVPSEVWAVFPFGDMFLFVAAPMADGTKDSYASLCLWSHAYTEILAQSRLRVASTCQSNDFLPCRAKRLRPIISPNRENLLLRWICAGSKDRSISITVNLSKVPQRLLDNKKPCIALDPHISATLTTHSTNLYYTVFLTDDIAVTGDVKGSLHIWDVHTGLIYRSVQSDPVPIDTPLLTNLVEYDSKGVESGPITAIAAAKPVQTETGDFTWFCSGDDTGCVVARRCVTTSNGASKTVASRVHAKFRPYFRGAGAFAADAVTCACLINRRGFQTQKHEAFLAAGDSAGCIRVWLLPQCTQLAQLSASCESGLHDLQVFQRSAGGDVPGQWLQIVGLVRRDRSVGSSYEHGRVVIIHLSANEENGVPNAMHSPRIRIVQRHQTPK